MLDPIVISGDAGVSVVGFKGFSDGFFAVADDFEGCFLGFLATFSGVFFAVMVFTFNFRVYGQIFGLHLTVRAWACCGAATAIGAF